MEKNISSADELKTIRQIMEESTKFLSISGLSGVFMGLFAIAGALITRLIVPESFSGNAVEALHWQIVMAALLVLFLSLATAFYFSQRKAKRSGKSFWTPVSRRLLINLFIPLVTGGLFALIIMYQNHIQLIIPVLLIFYGLGLINAGKFTYNEIFYLGIFEIIIGLFSAFNPENGIVFWILGFGVLHIVYGVYMYRKYEA